MFFQDCIFILELNILKACFFPENVLVHLIIPTLLLIVSPYLLAICNILYLFSFTGHWQKWKHFYIYFLIF